MSTSRLISLLAGAGIALSAFGAVYWPAALGYLAASPGALLMIFAVLLLPLAPSRPLSHEARAARRLLLYGLAVSFLSIGIYGLTSLYVSKAASLILLSTVWLAPLLCTDHLRLRDVRRGLIAGLTISAAGWIFGDVLRGSIPLVVQSLIFGGDYAGYQGMRYRAFMQENSHFAAMVGRYLFLVFLITEAARRYSAPRLALFMFALTLLLGVLGSKGAAFSMLAAVLIVLPTRRQFPYAILLLPIIWFVGAAQVQEVAIDIESFTSTSTRGTLLLASLAGTVVNPLGWGHYGFYGSIQRFGGWAMEWLSDRVPLATSELVDIVEDLNNVSTKSTLLDFMLIFGLPFLVMLFNLVRRTNLDDPRVRAAWVYLLLSAMSTAGHESISFFLGVSLLIHCYPRHARGSRRTPATGTPVVKPSDGTLA